MADAPSSERALARAAQAAQAAEAPLPPALRPAQEAIDRGDFRRGRALLVQVQASDPGAEVAAAARALKLATDNDPWAVRFGLLAMGLLALVIGAYIL